MTVVRSWLRRMGACSLLVLSVAPLGAAVPRVLDAHHALQRREQSIASHPSRSVPTIRSSR